MTRRGHWVRWVGLALGVGLFAAVLLQSDLPGVWSMLMDFRWRFAMVLAFYAVIFGLDTLGWRFALRPGLQAQVPWGHLFRVRLAGEAVNYVTPSAWIGGEPVKAVLLAQRHGIPMADGMSSVVVAKTTFALSMLLFIGLGLGLSLATQPLSASLVGWVWIALPILGLVSGLFLGVQFLRPFSRTAAALRRWRPAWFDPPLKRWRAGRIGARLKNWDEAVVSFYRQSPRFVFWSLGFHFLGWLAGALEVWLILRLLGIPASLTTAVSIEALWLLLRSGAFLIPASLGASEGIGLLVCSSVGISAVPGLALGLIRRARELTWMGVGLVELASGGTTR